MLNIGPQELLLILVIALIVVGPQRLPTLGRSIGRGLREIRKAQDEVRRTIQVNLDDEPSDQQAPRPSVASPERGAEREPAAAPDPTPLASEPPAPNEIADISRTLGRGLHELRRAKEEIRKSFRVTPGAPGTRPARPPAHTPEVTPPEGGAAADEAPTG